MSAQPYEAEPTGPSLAQPAVDILPAAAPRKGKQSAPEAEPAALPSEQEWPEAPAGATNPWTGLPSGEATAAPAAPLHLPADVATLQAPADDVFAPPAGASDESEPRRFLGMQLRRGRRGADATADASTSPIAAWPTDHGGAAVADAEPEHVSPWVAVPPAGAALSLPVETLPPVEATLRVDAPPVQAPPVDAPTPEPVLHAPAPVAVPVVAPPVAHDEVRALTSLLQASEAHRAAAESRADQAVAYAQQTQAELHQRESATAAQVAALETRVRTLANEAQDWQIRHREAETQIAELVASVAGAEARLAEMRTERDDLMAALEDVTRPDAGTASDAADAGLEAVGDRSAD